MRLQLPVLALIVLLTACGAHAQKTPATPTTGTPGSAGPHTSATMTTAPVATPRASPGVSSATTAPPAQQKTLPARPRAINTTGLDVCTLLTRQQGFENDGLRHNPIAPFYGNNRVQVCDFDTRGGQGVELLLSDRVGIEAWTTTRIDYATVTATSVNGFPAITAADTTHTQWCTVAVDLAPHVVLSALFIDHGETQTIPQATLCERARQTTELAMTTLTTTLGR